MYVGVCQWRGDWQREGWNIVPGAYQHCFLLHKKREFASSYNLLLVSGKWVRFKVMSCINRSSILSFKKWFFEHSYVLNNGFHAEERVGTRQLWALALWSWQQSPGTGSRVLTLEGTSKITSSTLYFTVIKLRPRENLTRKLGMNLTPITQPSPDWNPCLSILGPNFYSIPL